MKRRNRELNIFSMSALDLFASALGAFILITLILFPYYLNVDRKILQELEETKKSLSQCENRSNALQGQLTECKSEKNALNSQLLQSQQKNATLNSQLSQSKNNAQECKEGASQCAKELKKLFVVVVMTWNTKDDIDLHVVDPQGREYYYKKKKHASSNYELSVDTEIGPGVEIWEGPNAGSGTYKIYYKHYRTRDANTPYIKGRLYFRGEVIKLKMKTLPTQGQKVLVATVKIHNGKVDVVKH